MKMSGNRIGYNNIPNNNSNDIVIIGTRYFLRYEVRYRKIKGKKVPEGEIGSGWGRRRGRRCGGADTECVKNGKTKNVRTPAGEEERGGWRRALFQRGQN